MFRYITERFKEYHVKGMTVKDERSRAFHNLKTAKTCTLFWLADDVPLTTIENFRKVLAGHMDVCLLAFVKNPKKLVEREEEAFYVDGRCVSYGGQFNDMKLKGILEREDDLFLDLSLTSNVLSDYMVKCARSHCKIGMKREKIEHDVVLVDVQHVDEFVRRLLELLTKINAY